jgi:adenylate kinase family enzyme
MKEHRIHIFGASGSGTSTLGSMLADELSVRFFDADDYYWQDTEPPYTVKNLPEERVRTLSADMQKARNWVLSGSIVSWGDAFIPLFSLAVFVTLPKEVRMRRLAARERARYGPRIEVGGDRRVASEAFLNWAAQYDTAGPEIRSRWMHEEWIERLSCPVLRVQSVEPPEELAGRIIGHLAN